MAKHIILIHGRYFKPGETLLAEGLTKALRYGINRDLGTASADKFDSIKLSVVYYGDLSNYFLYKKGYKYNADADVIDRASSINNLQKYNSNQFTKNTYKGLYGRSGYMKILANLFSGILSFIGLGERIVGKYAPDIKEYWNTGNSWSSGVRERLTTPLVKSLEEDDDVLIIAHSLGSMVAYDVLWKLSYYGEYKNISDKQVQLITTGSPLGDPTIKKKLKGHGNKGSRAYPININKWSNVAAADDYISHVDRLDGVFANIINDYCIYNLAMRFSKSNPHHNAGYLISPIVARLVGKWMYE